MFEDFVKKAMKQDSRNKFEVFNGDISFVPEVMRLFYKDNNPKDVEVKIDGSYVRFSPIEDILVLQQEYDLGKENFVFASTNGEPIYLKKEKVYTCLFGKEGIIEEKIADSLNDYLQKIAV